MHSSHFERVGNHNLFVQFWTVEQPIAQVFLVHGFGEHSSRYGEMCDYLNKENISVIAYDRSGEGKSSGDRAYIKRFQDQVDDLQHLYQKYRSADVASFLYGHSVGGLIVSHLLVANSELKIAGAILSGAFLKPDDDLSPFLRKISGLVAAILPRVETVKVNANYISRDAEEVLKYKQDPLVYHYGTKARTGNELLKAVNHIQARFSDIKYPLLITHGGADKLADPKGSQMLYEKAGSKDKTLKIYREAYHEIMREPEKDQFFRLFCSWVKERSHS